MLLNQLCKLTVLSKIIKTTQIKHVSWPQILPLPASTVILILSSIQTLLAVFFSSTPATLTELILNIAQISMG